MRFGCQTNAWNIDPNDFQSFLDVLDKIRRYGFAGFETGFANIEAQFDNVGAARRAIEDSGLRLFGVHIFLNEYDPTTLLAPAALCERVAAGAARLGAERLVLSGAPASAEAIASKLAGLHAAGEAARHAGIKTSYHNHWPEFTESCREIEALIDGSDPGLVDFVLDAGHAFNAGADVAAFVRKHHRRIAAIHLRDFADGEQVPLGAGDFPLRELALAIEQCGWDGWLLNEEERLTHKPGDATVGPARDRLFRIFGRSGHRK